MIITIDGPAGSGKSTVTKLIAKEIGFLPFTSGSLYRAITAYLYYCNYDFNNINKETKFDNIELKVEFIEGNQHMFVNGVDYYNHLRENNISILTPKISENTCLRQIIDKCQKDFCSTHNVIVEGRDMGSYVFPNAEIKFFLECSVKERARRRFNEEKIKNPNITIKEIEKQIQERDDFDKNKTIAPFIIPDKAIIIDSSNLTIDETVKTIVKHIKEHI